MHSPIDDTTVTEFRNALVLDISKLMGNYGETYAGLTASELRAATLEAMGIIVAAAITTAPSINQQEVVSAFLETVGQLVRSRVKALETVS